MDIPRPQCRDEPELQVSLCVDGDVGVTKADNGVEIDAVLRQNDYNKEMGCTDIVGTLYIVFNMDY